MPKQCKGQHGYNVIVCGIDFFSLERGHEGKNLHDE